ncbi:hypothetical protein DM860_015373 [Cuscuta australis]|uniref:Uncharacterized protein n=1 Tax=Cuscuta australis TaxID=267555 RepID=A0A328DM94_9ASTE|nr:hypothetical protein DM860_015373 [Cuscuta australis]
MRTTQCFESMNSFFDYLSRVLECFKSLSKFRIIVAGMNKLYISASNVGEPASPLDHGRTADDVSEMDISGVAINHVIADPCVLQMKGRQRECSAGSSNGCFKGGLKKALANVPFCHGCVRTGHYKHNCPKKTDCKGSPS